MPRKIKTNATDETEVGNVILNYWESEPRWTKQKLLEELTAVLNLNGGQLKDVVLDVILDQDIDSDTRMVWIAVPTPDFKKNPSGNDPQTWKQYAAKFKQDEGTDAAKKLGGAVLFGCGR